MISGYLLAKQAREGSEVCVFQLIAILSEHTDGA